MSPATLKSIAQATGFSVTTVSRALGGFADVNEETRRLIQTEANRQNYQPNIGARKLKGQQSQTIGIVIPQQGNQSFDPFFTTLISGIGNRTSLSAFDLLLSTHPPQEADELEAYNRVIRGHSVDGMVLVRVRENDPRITLLQELKIPFVVFGRSPSHPSKSYIHIDIDGTAAQYILTKHLIEQGHERIAFIAPPQHLTFARYRVMGYENALHEAGIEIDSALLVYGEHLTEEGGRHWALQLLALDSPPTAIMTGNDRMALGVMAVVQERGLRIGYDIAIAGFDNIHSAAHVFPGLTTMHQPIYDIGEILADKLLGTIAGNPPTDPATILHAALIVRRSTVPDTDATTTRNI